MPVIGVGTTSDIPEAAFDRLAHGFRGSLVRPSDHDYPDARRVWNAMIDRYPAVVARCADADDVAAALSFATQLGVPVAVRGGGHSVAGFGTCDDGVVVDLSR